MQLNFPEFLKELKKRQIKVSVNDGKLTYTGPKDNITPEVLELLKLYKHRFISYSSDPGDANLMPVHVSGDRPPLFLVHAQEANYLISQRLGKEYPVYGFFHLGSNGRRVKVKTVEELADLYIRQIREHYPRGPYYLAGFSFGAALALEIAVRLQHDGHDIPFLLLVDPTALVPKKRRVRKYSNPLRFIKRNVYNPTEQFLIEQWNIIRGELHILMGKPIPVKLRPFFIIRYYLHLHKRHTYRRFNGSAVMVRTSDNDHPLGYLGYENVIGDIRIHHVEGDHMSIFRNREIGEILFRELSSI